MTSENKREDLAFDSRMRACRDELRWLFMELYDDAQAFDYFCGMLLRSYHERKDDLRRMDDRRVSEPGWYRSGRLLGMMLYPSAFAGTLRGVEGKLDYLAECGVNYLHLMPLLDSPKGKSDGGYAVSDFRRVRPDLGTMEDLEDLADACRERDIVLCLDFVLNHTSEEHPWARAARAGDPVARSRYFFYDSWEIPLQFERTVPQVFPTTAPGNYTYLPDCGQVVMTSFYPFQWDLNYANPMVLNDMTENLLYLANRGMDVIRLDAVPYIWKELGTDCRNRPQVHTITRILHLACQIVCPGVLLLGEVVMEPAKVAPYFGTPEKPECDMLYNVTTMCTTWHTLATADTRLLRYQMKQVCALPAGCLFLNYLRCHDDIGWGLDFPWLRQFGLEEVPHKRYLNDWFTGQWPGSPSRGELYNDDPRLGDARLCGTTASLCGIETAPEGPDLDRAIECDLMLHAWMFSQSGVPVLYSGDELAQRNDYTYHNDPEKADDSRYIHRGDFDWTAADRRHVPGTVEQRLFSGLRQLEKLRASHPVFRADAAVSVPDAGSTRLLAIERRYAGDRFVGVYNFSRESVAVGMDLRGMTDLLTGEPVEGPIALPPYGFLWLHS